MANYAGERGAVQTRAGGARSEEERGGAVAPPSPKISTLDQPRRPTVPLRTGSIRIRRIRRIRGRERVEFPSSIRPVRPRAWSRFHSRGFPVRSASLRSGLSGARTLLSTRRVPRGTSARRRGYRVRPPRSPNSRPQGSSILRGPPSTPRKPETASLRASTTASGR